MSAPPKKPGLSLYADLLNSDTTKAPGAIISGAPVRYDVKQAEEEAQKKKDASLKFQPIKRPQVPQKAKPKSTSSSSVHKFSSSTVTASASSPDRQLPNSTPQQQPSVQKSNFQDWVGDEDDYYPYPDRPRGARKKKRKNKGGQETRTWDWDDIYDPTLPNNHADYKGSEEQYREVRDWKARLYYHQLKEAKNQEKNSPTNGEKEEQRTGPTNKMFAPPSNLNFAPPSFDNDVRRPSMEEDDDYYPPPPSNGRRGSDGYTAPALAQIPNDASGEDAYLRRIRMSGMAMDQAASPTPPPHQPAAQAIPTPPVAKPPDPDVEIKRAEAQAKIAAFKAKLKARSEEKAANASAIAPTPPLSGADPAPAAPPQSQSPPPPPPPVSEPGAIISRAPVRYDVPPPASTLPDSEADAIEQQDATPELEQVRSNRPGKKGFAERLLKKYGWEKGRGLGAQGEGITTALIGKADKRKKNSDAQGGGWAQPANMGKIIGGKRRKVDSASGEQQDDARFGKMSEVIKLEGMLDGLDVQKEIEDNNLMQEIGDEMGGQYGNVERVFIWREAMGGKNEVFVKFTSQLSGLRAVNGMDGVEFAGNVVTAGFWDGEKFENGEYA